MKTHASRPAGFCILSLVLGLSGHANAALMPVFNENAAAWLATNVVVVNPGGFVLESWKGDARPGENIDVHSLGITANQLENVFAKNASGQWERQTLIGEKIVLFLIDTDKSEGRSWKSTIPAGSTLTIGYATVWIAKDSAYARKTMSSDRGTDAGVSRFTTVKELRATIQRNGAWQHRFQAVLREPNSKRRAWKLAPLVTSQSFAVYPALNALTNLRAEAMPVLRHLIISAPNRTWNFQIIDAIANAGPKAAVPSLVTIGEREIRFWQSAAPRLKKGWTHSQKVLAQRRQTIRSAMSHLRFSGDLRGKALASAVLRLLHSTPAFGESFDADGLAGICKDILHGTRRGGQWRPTPFIMEPAGL